jgi:hypothetical protein
MFSPVPPLVIVIPAALPFGVQVATAIVRLPAVIAMILNGAIQLGFGLFYGMLTLSSIIVIPARLWRRHEKHERSGHDYCDGGVSESSIQINPPVGPFDVVKMYRSCFEPNRV